MTAVETKLIVFGNPGLLFFFLFAFKKIYSWILVCKLNLSNSSKQKLKQTQRFHSGINFYFNKIIFKSKFSKLFCKFNNYSHKTGNFINQLTPMSHVLTCSSLKFSQNFNFRILYKIIFFLLEKNDILKNLFQSRNKTNEVELLA